MCVRTLEGNPNIKGTFFGEFLKQQLLCLSNENGRGFRWSKTIVHWALTLQFHGGKRIIEDLRGKASTGAGQHGELKIELKNWGIFLPANSTLRNFLPPVEVYEGVKRSTIENFKQAFPSGSPRKVLLSWDEIEIRYGLVWNPSTKELIGKVSGPIPEKDAEKENWKNMNSMLATHVVQYFLVSLDGAASIPIGFYPMTAVSGEKIFAIVDPILKLIEEGEGPLEVTATASDAFSSNGKLLEMLAAKGRSVIHVFDPLHLLKNMRNNLLKEPLAVGGTQFSMNTLDDLLKSTVKETRQGYMKLHPTSPFPKDQMDLAPIRTLLREPLIQKLRQDGGEAEKKFGEYIFHMRLFDLATTDNEMNNQKRFLDLEAVVSYFKTVSNLTAGLTQQLSTTVSSLKKIWEISEKDHFPFRPSVLGTIVVENFFSTVRAKCRYPNLWEFAVFSRRAHFELIKDNASDYSFMGPRKDQKWKKYNNQQGIHFSVADIKLMTKKEKKQVAQAKRDRNQGSSLDYQFCLEKGREYICKRKRMTIREVRSKDLPFDSKVKIQVRVRCPVKPCHKNYVYEGHLANHVFAKHSHKFKNIEDAQILAHEAVEEEAKRALRARAEDHGEVLQGTTLSVEMEGIGLPADDPESLGLEGEEEEMASGVGGLGIFDLAGFSFEDLTHDTLREWNDDALAEYQVDPRQGMTLEEWVRPPAPPTAVFPPPLRLSPGQSIRPLVIDFECGDFRHVEPIEMTVHCLITGATYTTLIKCDHPIHYRAYKVHGISRRMLEHEPTFPQAFADLKEWLRVMGHDDNEILIFLAHNSAFDLRVMKKALERAQLAFPSNWIFQDTIPIFKKHFPRQPSYALGKLAAALKLRHQPTHRSASDVRCVTELLGKGYGEEGVGEGVVKYVFGI